LHFVDHDEPAQVLKRDQRLGKLRLDLGVFQIEVIGRARIDEGTREGRLPDLARSHQKHRRASPQCGLDREGQRWAGDH
jgi:hypothetical protein